MEDWKPKAIAKKWLWVGTDLSESASINEEMLATRLLADLAVVTVGITLAKAVPAIGFAGSTAQEKVILNYEKLMQMYRATPGLPSDKLKGILEFVWACIKDHGYRGIVFAYDEAQTMSDHAAKEQYPLSLLLNVFQSIQKKIYP